ncbi:DUF397 domain-containing protein [Streptomyces sp. NBC_00433]
MTLKPSAGGGPALAWTKSSYSGSNNNDCVEVAWFKSSYSGSDNNDCVEVAAASGSVLVRDSKDPEGPRFSFTPEAWSSFLAYAATREV